VRAKCVCGAPLFGSDEAAMEERDMVIDGEKVDLEARTENNLLCQASM
jgi:importin subunit alpha-6/7